MTFLELQNEVLSDRFAETKRPNAKRWINYRYGRLWAAEDWTFKYAVVSYNLALNASTIPLGTIQRPISVWDSTTSPGYDMSEAIRPEVFYDTATRTPGVPVGFTVIGSNIMLSNPASSARTYQVLGQLGFVELSADGDVPLIPSEFHLLLAQGAAAEGLKDENDPSWQGKENDFKDGYEDLKKGYLTNVRIYGGFYPSWSPMHSS